METTIASPLSTVRPVPVHGRGTFVRRRVLVVLALAAMVGPWVGPIRDAVSGTERAVRVSRETYLVRAGDTLWSIAERLAPGEDPRPVVDAIAEVNGVAAGSLEVGQALVVPTR